MATKQIPNRCIWCLEKPPSATFNSESHVLPECVGNERQQVLPQGIVCDDCNHFFGGKVERALIDDPIFATIVGILQLRDKNREFVYERSPSGVQRDVHTDAKVSGNTVTVTTQCKIQGQPSKPYEDRSIPPKSKDYDKRSLALLSRAIHKIAFESLAHSLFVGTGLQFEKKELKELDIFDRSFDVIRDWARCGVPQRSVRPVLRLQKIDEVKKQEELYHWKYFLYEYQHWLRMELNNYNDWFIVSLTSTTENIEGDLIGWAKQTEFKQLVLMFGDKIQKII